MRALLDMDTIQIELTDACINQCSNCTRFCGHRKPFFMTKEQVIEALDSFEGFPKMIGFMGGEPLLHPQFAEFCYLARLRFKREQMGLWSCFPKGYEHYNEVICETFGNIFLNDHSRDDVYHCPVLVGVEEVFQDKNEMYYAIDHCWLQNYWSASINPKGAFFCEIAAAMSILFDGSPGWKVEKGWWYRTPKDFTSQIEEYCPKCGCSIPLKRRASIEGVDDISPKNLERLKGRSFKIDKGKYALSDLKMIKEPEQMASYKDSIYRQRIASQYGIWLSLNEHNFQEPILAKSCRPREKTVFEELKENYYGMP